MSEMTYDDFIHKYGVTGAAEQISSRPDMDTSDEWGRGAGHWRVMLRVGKRRMTVYFSQGSAHTKEPSVADVLDSLASDAASYDNARSFEEWAGEYGYDTDSRRAERTYRAVEKEAVGLKKLLGESAYDTLLYHVERL